MHVRRHGDVDSFLDTAGVFLADREAEHNLIFGILASLRETPEAYTGPAYLASVHDDAGAVTAAAIQTSPYRLVLSEIDDEAAVVALADDTVGRDLPGVLGPVGVVEAFVAHRRGAGGPDATHTETEQVYRISTVRLRGRSAADDDRRRQRTAMSSVHSSRASCSTRS